MGIYRVTRNYRAVKPVVIGVYFLFEAHDLVYVGRSINCYSRIDHHRAAGRHFDYALVMPCPQEDSDWVETALIHALAPKQNIAKGRQGFSAQGMHVLQEIARLRAEDEPQPPPGGVRAVWYDKLDAISITRARELAAARCIPVDAVDRAWRDVLPSFAKSDGPDAKRAVRMVDFDAWCDTYQTERMLTPA